MKKRETLKFIFFDIISSSSSWVLFFMFRKKLENQNFEIFNVSLIIGTIFVCLFWISLYTLLGKYKNVLRASRLHEFFNTIYQSLLGCVIIFFILILDDIQYQKNYIYYYKSVVFLFSSHFFLTFSLRYIISSKIVKKIKNGEIGFNTIIIGSSKKAFNIFNELNKLPKSSGNKIIGFIKETDRSEVLFPKSIKNLGNLSNLSQILKKTKVDEVILAIEKESNSFEQILYELDYHNVITKIIPKKIDLLSGNVKMSSIHAFPFTEILPSSMSQLESFLKRLFDIIISVFSLASLVPIFIITALLIKLTSKGPIFYFQTRAGKNRKPFKMIKFRSMHTNAEIEGKPKLTQENDTRVTKWGKFMRKYRIDELPQFYNVLIGEMSLVGPRPEREFFIEKILNSAPHYKLVFKVKPGITSWGMVRYGYADNVSKMIERLKFDIIYIENLSIFSDIKVLAYTLIIVLQGRGK